MASPLGAVVVGGISVIILGADLIKAINTLRNETGPSWCNVTRIMLDVVGIAFGGMGIAKGIKTIISDSIILSWTHYHSIQPRKNRGELRQSMGTPPSDMKSPQAHHNLPWVFREWFAGEGRGLNVNDPIYGRWVEGTPPGPHQKWSDIYELEWANFINRKPNANRFQVLAFLQQLLASGRFPS